MGLGVKAVRQQTTGKINQFQFLLPATYLQLYSILISANQMASSKLKCTPVS